MAITRTSQVDDDGSGTTGTIWNNAWKQELYDQIDATTASATSSFSFVDASGAGLVLNAVATLVDVRPGSKLYYVACQVVYPATATTQPAVLGFGSLPLTPTGANGLYLGFGPMALRFYLPHLSATVQILDGATGAAKTNAQMSGANFMLMGWFTATT